MILRAVVFDLGNTLVDWDVDWRSELPNLLRATFQGHAELLTSANLSVDALVKIAPRFISIEGGEPLKSLPFATRLANAMEALGVGIPEDDLSALSGDFTRRIASLGEIKTDSASTLTYLKAKGYRIGLVSNTAWETPWRPWRDCLEAIGLFPYFDAMAFSSQVGWRKPSPRIFSRAISEIETPKEHSLFVGDLPEDDMGGARQFGMKTAWIRSRRFPIWPNDAWSPDFVMDDIGDLKDVVGHVQGDS